MYKTEIVSGKYFISQTTGVQATVKDGVLSFQFEDVSNGQNNIVFAGNKQVYDLGLNYNC